MNAHRRKALAEIRERLGALIDDFNEAYADEPDGDARDLCEQVGDALDGARDTLDEVLDVGKKA